MHERRQRKLRRIKSRSRKHREKQLKRWRDREIGAVVCAKSFDHHVPSGLVQGVVRNRNGTVHQGDYLNETKEAG